MQELWAEEVGSFHGRYVDIEESWLFPKPIQAPHPPILIGGKGPTAIRHLAEFADGWMPMAGFSDERKKMVNEELQRVGRSIDQVDVTVFGPRPETSVLKRYQAIGVDRVVVSLETVDRDNALRALDECDKLTSPFR